MYVNATYISYHEYIMNIWMDVMPEYDGDLLMVGGCSMPAKQRVYRWDHLRSHQADESQMIRAYERLSANWSHQLPIPNLECIYIYIYIVKHI